MEGDAGKDTLLRAGYPVYPGRCGRPGTHGVEILQEIMRTPNMKMLLGNHEFMCLRYFAPDAPEKHIQHWNRNGNTPTLEGFSRLTQPEREQVLEFLRSLPTHLS